MNDLSAARNSALRLHAVDDRTLTRVAGQQDARDSQVTHHLQDLLEARSSRATHAARDDQVQADVTRLRQQVDEFRERVAPRGVRQVVIVDQDPQFGAGPPAALANLLGSDVRSG